VTAAPTLVITPPTSPPSVGLPASFTFTVTAATANGSAVRDVIVDWGDGDTQNLGAVNGAATVSHVFRDDDSYTVSATVRDASGNSTTVSTGVTVIPVPRPTVLVTASPQTQTVGGAVTFTIQITVATGIGVRSTTIDYGQGENEPTESLGGASSAVKTFTYQSPGSKTVTVTVVDTTGETTIGNTTVFITPP
jgi:PKD repeat protein